MMKPAVRIDSFKLDYVLRDAISKIEFLGKINETHDNNSELAGFEINKLLHEQSKLEASYADLIKARAQLKGIANRDSHQHVEKQIADVSRCLRENTKKLCRLFKENTNLDLDSQKVRSERTILLHDLRELGRFIDKNIVDQYIQEIDKQLLEQNKLGDCIKAEKELGTKIKDLKTRIAEETKEFEDLRKEKKAKIKELKDELTKSQTMQAARLRYQEKVSQTEVDTAKRINAMNMKKIQKDSEEVRELKRREDDVTSKLEAYTQQEGARIKERENQLVTSMDEQKRVLKEKRIKYEVEIRRETDLIEKLTKQIEEEKALREQEDMKIRELIARQAGEEQKNKLIDEKMMVIQQQFEEWMRLVGPSKRKKGGGAAKKK
jgi:hypothetical protein